MASLGRYVVFEQLLNDMKKPAMQRSGLLLKSLICVQLRSEMKLVSTLYLHKEFGGNVVGRVGEK